MARVLGPWLLSCKASYWKAGSTQPTNHACTPWPTLAHRGARSSTNFMVDSNGAMMSNLWSTQAYSFVQENTPAGEDGLLPGLCLFTELWLAKVALPLFRDTEASPPSTSLVKYFDDARVETLITVYDERNEGSLASSISSALSEIRKTVSSVAGAAAGGPAVGSSAGGRAAGCAGVACGVLRVSAHCQACVHSAVGLGSVRPREGTGKPEPAVASVHVPRTQVVRHAPAPPTATFSTLRTAPAPSLPAALDPLAWEEPPNRKLLVGAGVLGALGLAALASMFMRSSDSSAPSASSAATASGASLATAKSVADSPASRKVYTAAGQLDAKAAEQVVRAWQVGPSWAAHCMGSRSRLGSLLSPPFFWVQACLCLTLQGSSPELHP